MLWKILTRTCSSVFLAQVGLFSASLSTKNDSRFHSGNFSKGKAFYCAKVSYELLDYNTSTSLACVFVYF